MHIEDVVSYQRGAWPRRLLVLDPIMDRSDTSGKYELGMRVSSPFHERVRSTFE